MLGDDASAPSHIHVAGAGIYLPLTAVLGGLLFVIPEGYQEAQRDVIRLSANIGELAMQQGHLECEPLHVTQGGPVLPVPLHCSVVVTPAQVRPPCASQPAYLAGHAVMR